MFTKDLQELKSKQTEMSNIVKRSEVAQSCLTLCNPMDCQAPPSMGFSRQEYWSGLQGINSRITEAEEQINDLEDRMVEIITREQNIEKRMKRNDDNLKRSLKVKIAQSCSILCDSMESMEFSRSKYWSG